MKRKNISFEQLSDIMAFRITVDSVPNCYAALGVIHGRYAMVPERFKDFISTPKPNGYRSLHTTIFGPSAGASRCRSAPARCTRWPSSASPRTGPTSRRAADRRPAVPLAARPPGDPRAGLGAEEFLEHTKLEMFQDQVFCFTPRGDLIALPQGATPVDFAYAVHSEVGDTCVGAKINGRLVPLRTRLNHGDQVEIITSKGASPSPAWERFVVTGKARSRIRRFLRTRQRNDYIAHGRELLQRAAQRERVALGEKRLERCSRAFTRRASTTCWRRSARAR